MEQVYCRLFCEELLLPLEEEVKLLRPMRSRYSHISRRVRPLLYFPPHLLLRFSLSRQKNQRMNTQPGHEALNPL